MISNTPVPHPVLGPAMSGLLAHPKGVSGRIPVTVHPSVVVYARFRHIVGVPGGESSPGVPIVKLRVLDNLIDSYVSANSSKLRLPPPEEMKVSVDARTVDTYIAALSEQLRGDSGGAAPAESAMILTGMDFLPSGRALSLQA